MPLHHHIINTSSEYSVSQNLIDTIPRIIIFARHHATHHGQGARDRIYRSFWPCY